MVKKAAAEKAAASVFRPTFVDSYLLVVDEVVVLSVAGIVDVPDD